MRRSAALRYAGSWAVANAVLFTVSLLFFRDGHLGDASIIFIGYLYVIQALLGASAGAAFFATAVLVRIEDKPPGHMPIESLAVNLFRFGCAMVGFVWLWILTDLQQEPHMLQVLCAAIVACLASSLSIRSHDSSISS
jgi:hypothetical protein